MYYLNISHVLLKQILTVSILTLKLGCQPYDYSCCLLGFIYTFIRLLCLCRCRWAVAMMKCFSLLFQIVHLSVFHKRTHPNWTHNMKCMICRPSLLTTARACVQGSDLPQLHELVITSHCARESFCHRSVFVLLGTARFDSLTSLRR